MSADTNSLPPVTLEDGVRHFEPGRFLTVRDLRALIEGLDDSVQVTIADDAWYQHVEGVALPETPENEGTVGWCTVTLFPGIGEDYCFDAREI